jgi:hypothetical protein
VDAGEQVQFLWVDKYCIHMVKKIVLIYLLVGIIQTGRAQNGLINNIALRDTSRLHELTGENGETYTDSLIPKKNYWKKPVFGFNLFSATHQYN